MASKINIIEIAIIWLTIKAPSTPLLSYFPLWLIASKKTHPEKKGTEIVPLGALYMLEQRETCLFSMVLIIKENSYEGGAGSLKPLHIY